ncbi:MAG: sugar isomerase [Clostridia bacterium]|nr:sugar isomerase [Clostridia bacterium]
MNRSGKLKLNTATSLLNQIIALVCGFILPRLILAEYGSSVNGLVSSITQFLGLITLCELGVGAVVQSTLYKPLADNDLLMISKVMVSARRFFNKVGIILIAYVAVLAGLYPFSVLSEFDFLSTVLLIGAMSISYFAQYFFGISNQLLLNADQRAYIPLTLQILTTIANTIASVVLIRFGASIQVVKLVSSIVFLVRPIFLFFYVKRSYKIDYSIKLLQEPISQKWNGLAQHLATVVQGNTPTVVLTIFSTLIKVSIFNVYNLVANGLKQILTSLTAGVQALFGNMLAKGEKEELNSTFNTVEWFIHTIAVFVFTVAGMLIVPFVTVYTSGISDANYVEPIFAVLLMVASACYCLRLPYSMIVLAAGHYRQTQKSAIVEMVITLVIAIGSVFFFDLIGMAVAMLVAMVYRTVYYVLYLKKTIMMRSLKKFIKQVIVDFITVIAIICATFWLRLAKVSYLSWVILAVEVALIAIVVSLIINVICYKKVILGILKRKNRS